jgi:hypothetical protein
VARLSVVWGAFDEDRCDIARAVFDGLIAEIYKASFWYRAGRPLKNEVHIPAGEGFSGCKHIVQELKKILTFNSGKASRTIRPMTSRWPINCW